MPTGLVVTLGLLAGLVAVADPIPYIRDTVRGRTRPHRGTWLIWSVLAIVAFLAQHADGAAWSLPMVGVQALLTTVILALALRRGEGGVSRGELLLIGIAGAGVVGWLSADEPLVATVCVVLAGRPKRATDQIGGEAAAQQMSVHPLAFLARWIGRPAFAAQDLSKRHELVITGDLAEYLVDDVA